MSLVSRLIVVQADPRVAQALRFAFEGQGAAVELVPVPGWGASEEASEDSAGDSDGDSNGIWAELLGPGEQASADGGGGQVIIAGAGSGERAPALLRSLRAAVTAAGAEVPILYLGNGVSRRAALEAGASEVVAGPAFLRDVVTMARLVASRRRNNADTYRGELEHIGSAFYLLRAISATGRSAVLTMVRGLRRAEVRFFEGEATSAQIGMLHGLPALRHMLLWRKANFELRFEDVVRRQQIPMTPDELIRNAQQFLDEVAEVARDLDLGAVYQGVPDKIRKTRIPEPIRAVLRLMDRSRAVPDVAEDSPYRLLDTLRVVQRLVELELVEPVEVQSSTFSMQLVGGLDEWFMSDGSSLPRAGSRGDAGAEAEEGELESVDWSDVLPTPLHSEEKLAQVVPASSAVGEIVVAADEVEDTSGVPEREQSAEPTSPRPEGLETLTSAEQRGRLFALGDASHLREAHSNRDHASRSMQSEASDTSAAPDRDETASEAEHRDAAGDDQAAGETGDEAGEGEAGEASEEGETGEEAKDGEDEGGEEDRETREGEARAGEELGFTADEEAFFAEGTELASKAPPAESFADLDDGYEPQSFWDRLLGRRKRRRPAPQRSDAASQTRSKPAQGSKKRKKRR